MIDNDLGGETASVDETTSYVRHVLVKQIKMRKTKSTSSKGDVLEDI